MNGGPGAAPPGSGVQGAAAPGGVQGAEPLAGISGFCFSVLYLPNTWGTNGSLIHWTYNVGGAKNVSKEIVEGIDEKKKSITYKVIEGDPLKLYSEFKIKCDVESNGHDNIVTYTLEYKKRNGQSLEPTGFMDLLVHQFSKEIEECNRRLRPN
ncbi:kirola-like [Salvia hispanica]|uniref:kirola-like n=1 Tax=Salvia hispanica TaxID=49212 RepID=UPI00200958E8|nr:kirola-like [Salvia hispanica]